MQKLETLADSSTGPLAVPTSCTKHCGFGSFAYLSLALKNWKKKEGDSLIHSC